MICANFVGAHSGIRLGVSAKRSLVKDCENLETLKAHLLESSSEEIAKAVEAIGSTRVTDRIDEINTRIDDVLTKQDWKDALKLIDGKRIGNKMAHIVGVRNASDLMRAISANIQISEIPEVADLAKQLNESMPNKAEQATANAAPVL